MRRAAAATAIATLAWTTFAAAATSGTPGTRLGVISFRSVAVPDDVPAHLVTALTQDHDGFIWMGTQDGLVRFDGYGFRTYKPNASDRTSLGGAYVRCLTTTRDGRIWIGTFADGLSVYDPATDRFTQLRHDEANRASLVHDRIEHVAEAPNGDLWIATYAGLDRYDPRSGAFQHFRHAPGDPSSLADDRTRGLLIDRAGNVWVGTARGLQRLRPGSRRFETIGPANFVGELYEDAAGRIWVGTNDAGAEVFDPSTNTLHTLTGLSFFWISAITEATDDEVWLGTYGGGIDVVDPRTLQVVDRLRHDATLPTTIGADRIGALLRDRAGVVWVGTWGEGPTRHDPSTRAFRTIRYSPQRPDGISYAAVVRAMQARDGSIWVGTNGNGVDLFDGSFRRTGSYRPNPRDAGALADGSITCLAQTSDGSIWVATLDGTLHRLRPGSRRFERFTRAAGLPGGAVRGLTEGPGGVLWIASANGLARLELRSGSIAAFVHDPRDPRSLASNTVEGVAVLPDGSVWVGTDSGLHVLDSARGGFTRITHDPGRADSLPNNWVPDLTVAGGRLWVATQSGAAVLTGWDGRTARFDRVAARIGRPEAPVGSIIADADGWIWAGARLRVNPATWDFQEFGPADGNDFRSFYFASRGRTLDGRLLFGSADGLLVVQPSALHAWRYQPPLVVTAERVDGVDHLPQARPDRLVLPARTRGFQIEFAALDLSAPERNLYRYRLDGFDRDWTVTTASRRSVTYTNLPPGSYTLRVQGSNRAHVWSAQELQVAVTLLPAFYQTVWARLAFALVVLALGYVVYRLRVRQLQARGRELERIVHDRTAALQEAYAKIEEASLTDLVTGLHNRRFIEQTIEPDLDLAVRQLRRGDAQGRRDHLFLLLDLDHFKSVNDRFGHAAGDAVLRQTAAVLRETVRASDYLVRWGGEEFLVIARFNDRAEGVTIAEKIRAAIAAHEFVRPDGGSLRMTCSIGFAAFPFALTDPLAIGWERIVHVADLGLYQAKRRGRNGWIGVDAASAPDPDATVSAIEERPSAAGSVAHVTTFASRNADSIPA